jgi:hypothetical protein
LGGVGSGRLAKVKVGVGNGTAEFRESGGSAVDLRQASKGIWDAYERGLCMRIFILAPRPQSGSAPEESEAFLSIEREIRPFYIQI